MTTNGYGLSSFCDKIDTPIDSINLSVISFTEDIWKKYQQGGRYRPCVFGHVETRKFETCYLMYPRLINVLHKDTVYLKDGEIDQICLCRELVEIHRVFGVKGKHRTDIVIAGDVLEEMLKEEIVGFQAVPVSVKEGTPWQKNM